MIAKVAKRKMLQIYSNSLFIRAEIFIEEIGNIEYICDLNIPFGFTTPIFSRFLYLLES